MRVAMIGTGYVGLVSGACFADFGHEVTCVDKDEAKIAALERGEIPIYEPGLDDLVESNVKAGRLKFTTELAPAVKAADAVFIAVGTPARRGDGHADLSYVYGAAREIAAAMDGFTVVITKSTVPVGTGDEVERVIAETQRRLRLRGGVEPGVPARGRGHPRLQASRPHRGRHRRRARPRGDERALSAALPQPRAAPVHRPPHGRADQIRGQCVPRHQDHLHQRDRRPRREGGRRRAGDRARHRARQPHRLQVPARRPRLRRLVLSEGYAGADEDRAGQRRRRCASSRRWCRSTTSASAPWRARSRPRSAARCAARRWPCSASPSSRTPTTCARRRRFR